MELGAPRVSKWTPKSLKNRWKNTLGHRWRRQGSLWRPREHLGVPPLTKTSPKTPEKIVVITAARAKEPANWDIEAKQGLFTKHLLLALKGEADLVQYGGNNDGEITLGEVERYLDSEMTYEAIKINRQQNATISGDPERVLSKYNRWKKTKTSMTRY